MRQTAEAVVVGAGIQGTSVAYHLAQKGLTNVVVLEMRTIGSGSSGRSASMTTFQSSRRAWLDLIRISQEAYRRFQDEFGVEPGYRPIGQLRLVTESQSHLPAFQRTPTGARLQTEFGCVGQVLQVSEIKALVPGLNLQDIAFGLYSPEDGVLDPHTIYSAYAREARQMGVRIMEGIKATGLEIRNDRVTGVKSSAGTISTPRVINAAGFAAGEVAAWANLNLPIKNLKRHIFVTEPVPQFRPPFPFVHDLGADWYFRPEGPGVIMGMGESPSDEDDPQVEWSFLQQVVEQALYRAPGLAEARVMRGWAGLRPMTPDGDPILGEAAACPGFYNCSGWGGHGVMHAPAGGILTSELIVEGSVRSGDISSFRLERFLGVVDSNRQRV